MKKKPQLSGIKKLTLTKDTVRGLDGSHPDTPSSLSDPGTSCFTCHCPP